MTYLRFLANFQRRLMTDKAGSLDKERAFVYESIQKARHKVYALVGKEARIQNDVLKILLKRIERTDGASTNIWYHLDEIADAPLLILHESGFGVRILVWTPNTLNPEKRENLKVVKKLLNGLQELSGRSIILDEAEELRDVYKNVYGKSSKGAIIDCSKKPRITEEFVEARLHRMLRFKASDEVYVDLSRDDMTISNLFNIFAILEALNQEKIGLDDLRRFDLLRAEPETFLVDELFKKGKQEVLRYDFREIVPGRFFTRLYWSLIQRLQVKSTSSMQPTVAAGKLDMTLFQYSRSRKEVMKFDFRDLYRRLYLVFSLMRWREHLGSVYLLLLYW